MGSADCGPVRGTHSCRTKLKLVMTTVEDVTVGVESSSPSPPMARLAFRLFVASIVVAVVPIAVATARAIHNGWLPTGDNALFAVGAATCSRITFRCSVRGPRRR
jgi:hypothetical protein